MRPIVGLLACGVVLIVGCNAGSAAPPATPMNPNRPNRNIPVEKRPQIEFNTLQFSTPELQQEAKLFHDLADAMVGKDGSAVRYQDASYGVPPWYVGSWRAVAPDSRKMSQLFHGKFVNCVDQFDRISAQGSASAGAWQAYLGYELTPQSMGKLATLWVMIGPVAKTGTAEREIAEQRLYVTSRHVEVRFHDEPLHYALRIQLPHAKDPKIVGPMLFTTPESLRDGMLADIESLRTLVRKELPLHLTVYDDRQVSSDNPPQRMPIGKIAPELEARALKLADSQLDADAALMRENFRDIHSAVQQALPRELFAAEIDAALQE